MKKFAIVFSSVIAICVVALLFIRLLKYFFGEIYYIDALGFILVCFYSFFAIKNDIKKSDLTKKNLKNIDINYGSVALFYTIVILLIWLMLICIRFF